MTMIGWGANTLISDKGIRGLVVKQKSLMISLVENVQQHSSIPEVEARWQKGDNTDEYVDFSAINYDESQTPTQLINIAAGVPLPYAITHTIDKGLTGLQWFSRIPATIGGAIYNNIHGGTHFFSECVDSVQAVNPKGKVVRIENAEMEFGYDYSRFHHSKEIIISAQLILHKGDTDRAKKLVRDWAVQKKDQPQNSLGCVFQNISEEDQKKLKIPTPSVGYIIDQILHKKGYAIGDAKISEKHAAFIENVGKATAHDYLTLIKLIVSETKQKTGISLQPEIFFKGFTKEELKGVVHN